MGEPQYPDDLVVDGMEKIRRNWDLAKATFYGPGGPARLMETIQLSAKRRGATRKEQRRYLTERARQPEQAA